MCAIDAAQPPPTAIAERLAALPTGGGSMGGGTSGIGWALARLGLADCWVGDAGTAALRAVLARAPALQHLDLRMNAMHSTATPIAGSGGHTPIRVEWLAQAKPEGGLCEGW